MVPFFHSTAGYGAVRILRIAPSHSGQQFTAHRRSQPAGRHPRSPCMEFLNPVNDGGGYGSGPDFPSFFTGGGIHRCAPARPWSHADGQCSHFPEAGRRAHVQKTGRGDGGPGSLRRTAGMGMHQEVCLEHQLPQTVPPLFQ